MAKAKTKATNLRVPQNDGEAELMLAQLGVSQRDQAEAQTRHDTVIAAHEAEHGKSIKEFQDAQTAMIEGLSIWATANRARLTQDGRTKTVQLPTGRLLWRDGRYAVKHRGLKKDGVVRVIEDRIAELQAQKATGCPRSLALRIGEEIGKLQGFLRHSVEPNKEAMLSAREVAEKIPGITISRGAEEFVAEPIGSQISEVASS